MQLLIIIALIAFISLIGYSGYTNTPYHTFVVHCERAGGHVEVEKQNGVNKHVCNVREDK